MGDKRDNNCVGEECLKNQLEHIISHMTIHRQDEGPPTMGCLVEPHSHGLIAKNHVNPSKV